MPDPYLDTYQDEIFVQSQCIWHENTLMDFIRSQLIALGYQPLDVSNKVWQRGEHKVVVCLVDDFTTCSDDHSTPTSYKFDTKTTVITDTWTGVPTQYRICRLPHSFFGIYSHTPQTRVWNPDRRFCYSARRLDAKRMLLWLEIEYRRCMQTDLQDYINFASWAWEGDNSSPEGRQLSFTNQYGLLSEDARNNYETVREIFTPRIPFSNHDLDHEEMHHRAWINIVAETYSSDNCIAFSEKTFRALCYPVPWAVYCGRGAVAYLTSMGFDVMPDLVPHHYDTLFDASSPLSGDKTVEFVYQASQAAAAMRQQDLSQLRSRAQAAALHNQEILRGLRAQWPRDFATWWAQTLEHIA